MKMLYHTKSLLEREFPIGRVIFNAYTNQNEEVREYSPCRAGYYGDGLCFSHGGKCLFEGKVVVTETGTRWCHSLFKHLGGS